MALYREQLEQYKRPARGITLTLVSLGLIWLGVLTWQIFSRLQQPTPEQVATIRPAPPILLQVGPIPWGGANEAPTAAEAGGSGAAGYETGRVGSSVEGPTTPPFPYGVTDSRMSPVASDGSSGADRGHPLAPDQPLVPANAHSVSQPISANPDQLPVNVRQ